MKREILEKILELACRAPSTHNTQPWLFKISSPESLEIFIDEKCFLPIADPEQRYLYISIGCMLENLQLAAENFQYKARLDFDFSNNKVCRVIFFPNIEDNNLNKKLFEQIPRRVNARGIFTDQKIDDKTKITLSDMIEDFVFKHKEKNLQIKFIEQKEEVEKVAELAKEVVTKVYGEKKFRGEFSRFINSNISNKKTGIPGYALNMPLPVSIVLPYVMRFFNLGKTLGLLNFKSIKNAPMIISFASASNPENFVLIGMIAEKIMLFLQSKQYDTSIFTAMIEVGEAHFEIEKIFNFTQRSQFLFCAGKFPETSSRKLTPRINFKDKIIK